ncbi:hypothetical protein [Alkalihalobacillus deserti]|uniref:hypothetical protein n=1 Tax=Alkalihalobacillus deserti TaxID=2879466 RepID=UPI001D1380A7|nr:hypothetical protein [Alkalihalobacillus deserti]
MVSLDENEFVVMVNDYLTEEEKQHFIRPEKIEGYRIMFEENTRFFDENNNELRLEEAYPSFHTKIWVKGEF